MEKIRLLKTIEITLLIIGFTMIVLAFVIMTIEMLIDHECYQLVPGDFYQSSICERYWKTDDK